MIANNPVEIIQTLDQELDHEVSLVLYGRAALSIGFDNAPMHFQTTQDVDAIISLAQLPALTNDDQFWQAIDRTNDLLSPKGLYITHLFVEDQVFLRPYWKDMVVPITSVKTKYLKLFRPHVIDLILTKMMPGNDELDVQDIRFLVTTEQILISEMEEAFSSVRLPEDIPELSEAFQRVLPSVRAILSPAQML